MGWGTLAKIGGFVAAPFTGGWSIPAGMAAGAGLDARGNRGGGGGSGANANASGASPSDDGDLNPYAQILKNNAQALNLRGQGMQDLGASTIAPAVQYFQNLLTGGGAAEQATKAVRGKVIDQYDTARQAIAKFAPRGGGQVSAIAQSRFDQAGQVSDISAALQNDAGSKLATLGTSLSGLGLTAQQMAGNNLESLIQSVLAQRGLDLTARGQDRALYGDLGEAAGNIIGMILAGGDD